jgi:hypothetical protein
MLEHRQNSENSEAKIDSYWYAKLSEILKDFENQDFSKIPKEKEALLRKNFEENGQIPDLTPDNFNPDQLRELDKKLREFRKELLTTEERPEIRLPYLWRVNISIARCGLFTAAMEDDMLKYKRYVEFIYGRPDLKVFNYTLEKLHSELDESINSESEALRTAALELKQSIPLPNENIETVKHPSTKEFLSIKEKIAEEFGELMEKINEEKEYNSDETKEIFQTVFLELGYTDWKTEIDDSKKFIAIRPKSKKLLIPQKLKRKGKEIKRLIAHEIFGHAKRRELSEKSPFELMKEMDRYVVGEEAVTVLKEQSLEEKLSSFSDHPNHLAIGLVYGLDGTKRNFADIYQILLKYYTYSNIKNGEDPKKAIDTAWDRTCRYFKGTDGKTEGLCYTKDIVYREGNAGLWQLLKKHPELLTMTELGKWDINNPTHWWALLANGIIKPEDMKYLESVEQLAFKDLKPGIKKDLLDKYRGELINRIKSTIDGNK